MITTTETIGTAAGITPLDFSNHPCFNKDAHKTAGRVHLPVAPRCNIQCNFCNRKYDCMNESRPGVTSNVLTPQQAIAYLAEVVAKRPEISVMGIAGPGDPFANPEETMETLRLTRKHFPKMLLCVATNGLNVAPYIDEMADLQVSHVTLTINAVDPEIGGDIYSWVRDGKRPLRGREAAELLSARQIEALPAAYMNGGPTAILADDLRALHALPTSEARANGRTETRGVAARAYGKTRPGVFLKRSRRRAPGARCREGRELPPRNERGCDLRAARSRAASGRRPEG